MKSLRLILAFVIVLGPAAGVRAQFAPLETGNPLSYLVAALILCAAVVASAWAPVRRALTVDPAVALRAD